MSRNSAELVALALINGASMMSIALADIARSNNPSLGKPIQICAWIVLFLSGIFFVVGFLSRPDETQAIDDGKDGSSSDH